MTKIVFLDFDGVLNSYGDLVRALDPSKATFDRAAVARLDAIVARTGAKVVISSSWRIRHSLERLRSLLSANGFSGEVIDTTPVLRSLDPFAVSPGDRRCGEIQAWLDAQPLRPRAFVVIDDMDLEMLAAFHIRTDAETGLCDEHVDMAVELLGTD